MLLNELKIEDNAPYIPPNAKGKKLVLYFYPKDDTPGCTLEAKDFAMLAEDFKKAGAVIIGVSKDSEDSHQKFKQKYCLNFDLLSDADGQICNHYGVWVKKNMYGKEYMGIERSSFVIGEDGKIKAIWRKVKVDNHANEVLSVVQKI